jgi:hypothetical protein
VDEGQIEELRRWGAGLESDERPEVRAAGKAIRLLADDLLATGSQLHEERLIRTALEEREQQEQARAEEAARQGLALDLRSRILRATRRPVQK